MSTETLSKTKLLLTAFNNRNMMTTAEIEQLGMSREYLRRLVKSGQVHRLSRGLYAAANAPFNSHVTVVEASRLIPGGVICLLTALRYHELTTQSPFEVWIAVAREAWKPNPDGLSVRYVEMREPSFSAGVENHTIDNISIPIFCVAKTLADCFKFRNKIGIDVAIEALRDALRRKSTNADEIWHYAKICRVSKVIYPYLEAIE
jgi:predicted transcriptional regulator of viral defense system